MERTTTSAKYNINYHFVWCPKYRKTILTEEKINFLKLIIHNIARENNWEILELKVMPDHIHLFLSASPLFSPIQIVQILKGKSAREIFIQFPELRHILRKGHLWSPSYYIGTAGHVSEETIQRYIQEQEKRNSSTAIIS
jgi:putative transposase